MADFFASCPQEMSVVLEKELNNLGFEKTERINSGVYFESSWEGCYRANLHSRLASRIYKPVLEFIAYDQEQLYREIQRHDFTKYIDPQQTLAIDTVINDCKLHDQRFVTMVIKDAIVDQFREKKGERPSIDSKNADLRIHVKGTKNTFWVALDTSGSGLYQRGYRREVGEAPIKENLAAGLIEIAEWDKQSAFVDPMCGAGTFLIEAALMALNIAPGTLRKRFGFQNWLNYKSDVWDKLVSEALNNEKEMIDFPILGYDIDRQVISKAKSNARLAGVDHVVKFQTEAVAVVKAPCEKGIMITNPPYGARIGEEDNLKDAYKDLGFTMKNHFKNWDCWILSGNKDLILEMKLKSSRRVFVYNGPIECRFLKYEMF
ncbi:MAG: THUMP domain-containing protein [Bdellovibrionaceae bacterium]|nr:THUMP domain-containing protein [Pseudobdellovibrionaceae bacterium]NUM58912.1 RNA methyltransferase [Pseudobdellovibrionaceae bacterium]